MNATAIYWMGAEIRWSAVIITVGILACLCMTMALYRGRGHGGAAVWMLLPLGFILGLFLGRLLHWYFNTELYGSFARAFTDFSLGSYVLPGVVLGIWLAAGLEGRMGLCSRDELLDCLAPGLCLLILFTRLSAFFDNTCRSRILIESPAWQRLPFAVSTADAAGNVVWRFASFMTEAICMGLIFELLLWFYLQRRSTPREPWGHTWRMFLLWFAAETVVTDSTRYDSPLMHFHIFSSLNAYSSFISFAQIFAAVTALYVVLYYTVRSIRAGGMKLWQPAAWVMFALFLYTAGYLGEYKVQRTNMYLRCYLIQSLSCLVLAVMGYLVYLGWERSLSRRGKKPKSEVYE